MDTQTTRHVEWADVEAAARPVLVVWESGSEVLWASYAWGALGSVGLTAYSTELERTRCVLRAVALGALGRDFYAYAQDEGSYGDSQYSMAADLFGESPVIDAFTLGQMVERTGLEYDNSPEYDGSLSDVLLVLIREEYSVVAKALRAAWRDAALFTSLWASSGSGTSFPMPEDEISELVYEDTTSLKLRAWNWLVQLT